MQIKTIDDITPNDIIGEDLFNRDLLMLKKGTTLSGEMIAQLKKQNIKQLRIMDRHSNQDSFFTNRMDQIFKHIDLDAEVLSKMHDDSLFLDTLSQVGFEYRYGKILHKEADVTLLMDLFQKIQADKQKMKLLVTLQSYDPYSFIHVFDTFVLGTLLAKKAKVKHLETVALGCLLHDIGKIYVPEKLLNKPGKLNMEEFQDMQSHLGEGVYLLEKIDLAHIARFAKPYQNKEKDSQDMNILHIVDVYSALTSKRAYKKALNGQEALDIMFKDHEKFDVNLLILFAEALNIFPTEATVLLSDNTQAVIERNKQFLTLQKVKRLYTTNATYQNVTVSKLLTYKKPSFQMLYNDLEKHVYASDSGHIVDKFYYMIDGYKLEDIYVSILLPMYRKLLLLNQRNQLLPEKVRNCMDNMQLLLKQLKNDMIKSTEYQAKIALLVNVAQQQSIEAAFLINLLHLEKVLPITLDINSSDADIKERLNRHDIQQICVVASMDDYQETAMQSVFSHIDIIPLTNHLISQILVSLVQTKAQKLDMYHRIFQAK